jgi:hypothetical protein
MTIEHPDYEATRLRLMRDPHVQAMALGMAPRDRDDPTVNLCHEGGGPRHDFMLAANREYHARVGRVAETTRVEGYARNAGHIGAVAEAILRLLALPLADWPAPADEQLQLGHVVAVVPPPGAPGWTGPVTVPGATRPRYEPTWCATPPLTPARRDTAVHEQTANQIKLGNLTVIRCDVHDGPGERADLPGLTCTRCGHPRREHIPHLVAMIGKRWFECHACTCAGYVVTL